MFDIAGGLGASHLAQQGQEPAAVVTCQPRFRFRGRVTGVAERVTRALYQVIPGRGVTALSGSVGRFCGRNNEYPQTDHADRSRGRKKQGHVDRDAVWGLLLGPGSFRLSCNTSLLRSHSIDRCVRREGKLLRTTRISHSCANPVLYCAISARADAKNR